MHVEDVMEKIMRKSVQSGSCRVWTGSKRYCGYGVLNVEKKIWAVHRYVYTVKVGPIPKGMILCHTCDNPACFNVDHLFLGTDKTNALDKVAKMRHVYGEKVVQSKLKEAQVLSIRQDNRRLVDIAKDYNVTPDNIALIKNRITWKHLP
jgi:hypothetical protein